MYVVFGVNHNMDVLLVVPWKVKSYMHGTEETVELLLDLIGGLLF